MLRSFINIMTGRPTLCVYDATTRCNSRCSMCSIWKRREEEMPLAQIGKVFSDLRRFGIHTVFLQGGEPLMRKDVLDIVSLLDRMGFHVNLISNGILLDEGLLERLDGINGSGRITVTVSLDSLDPKKYARIRGVDMLDKVKENITALSRHPRLDGGLHATLTSINYGELPALMDFAAGLGLEFTFNSYNDNINYASSSDTGLSLRDAPAEQIIEEMEKAKATMPYLYRRFIDGNIKYLRGKPLGPCDAFRNSIRLTSDGRLSPCLELPPVLDLRVKDICREWKDISARMVCPIKRCYTKTPCFYGCTRGVGSVRGSLPAMAYGLATSAARGVRRQSRRRKRAS